MKEPPKVIKMEWIDKQDGIKYTTVIEKDGVRQDKEDIINSLIDFVKAKLDTDTSNATKNQVNPLIIDVITHTLSKIVSLKEASMLLSDKEVLTALRYSGMVSFYLMKYLDKNNLTLKTIEEKISKEDVKEYLNLTLINQVISELMALGYSPVQVAQEMYKKKYITKDELIKMGFPPDSFDLLMEGTDKPDSQN